MLSQVEAESSAQRYIDILEGMAAAAELFLGTWSCHSCRPLWFEGSVRSLFRR